MKTAQINIGGQVRNLDYYLSGWYDHLEMVTKQPAFDYLQKLIPKKDEPYNITKQDIAYLLYAGINCAHERDGEELETIEQVEKLLRLTPVKELSEIYTTVFNTMGEGETGEAESQPEAVL